MTNFSVCLLWALSTTAFAEPYFLQTRRSQKTFAEVERISRNHDFNEYRGGELILKPYVELDERSYLGLDGTGRLMQVLVTPERTLGFLLSGEKHLVDFFYKPGGTLIAIDDRGEMFGFDREEWQRNPRFEIQRKMLASYALTMSAAGGTLGWVALEWGLPLVDVLVPAIPIAVGLTIQHGLLFAMAFGEQNDLTDGLRPLGLVLDSFAVAESVGAQSGEAEDYLLHARGQSFSLRALMFEFASGPSEMFDVSCEPALARGYPIRMPYSGEAPPKRSKLLGRRE